MQRVLARISTWATKSVVLMFLFVGATGLLQPLAAYAAGSYTITYINNGTSTVRTYTAGSTITLEPLPGGAIAWTDDHDPSVPNGKMAYVSYDRQITITRDMTLNADYGSYANGAQGPRLIQFHLELKYYENDITAMMEFQQQYANTNAPSGYYIHLPNEDFFDPITFTTSPPVDIEDPNLKIYKWIYDASYTGGAVDDPTLLHDPSSLIYVDPNDYNQIYNVMVNPDFTVTQPGGPGTTATVLPATLPRDTVAFSVSQKDLPVGGGFVADGLQYTYDLGNDTSGNVYMQRPFNGQLWVTAFTDSTDYDLLPVPQTIAGYTYYWIKASADPDLSTAPEPDASSLSATPMLTIPTSYQYILQYVPDSPLRPVTIIAARKTVVWNGQAHTVEGYTADGLVDGDQLVFSSRSLLARTSVTGTDVGTYPLVMSPRDFYITDALGTVVSGKYTISVIGGGLTILPVPPVGAPDTGLDTTNTLRYLAAIAGGLFLLALLFYARRAVTIWRGRV